MTHFLTTQIAKHGYAAVFVLMVLESACIPIPSEVVMLFGGALAGGLLAASHPHVGLVGIGLAGALGNLAGSLVAYAAGRAGGRPLVERYGHYVLLREDHIDKAERFFARRGDMAVLVGRLLPVVRTFISLPAGMAEMPLARFTLYTLLGCLPWTFALAAAGDALASNWDSVTPYFTAASVVIAVGIIAVAARWLLKVRQQRNQTAAGPDRPPTEWKLD